MNRRIQAIYKLYHQNQKYIQKTPLEFNQRLSDRLGCNLYLKREDTQRIRSFKSRGALNKILQLSNDEKKQGIVCASAGNHAQGVSISCNKLDISCDIFVPENTPFQKINSIKKFLSNKEDQATLHIKGENFDECLGISMVFAHEHGKTFIHPFDDDDVINGQSTVAVEIYEDLDNVDMIVGCIGGGGLMSGVSMYSKYKNPNCLLYGVETMGCNSMDKSIQEGKVVTLENYDTFVDGASVRRVGEKTFEICKNNLDKIELVENGQLCHTILDLYTNDGIITEPAGALSVAALDNLDKNLIRGKNVVAIVSGGNNDVTRYPEIQELALRYKNLKHYFILEFNQKPGELKKFVNNILSPFDDITRFEYMKKTNKSYGQVLVGVELSDAKNIYGILENLKINNFKYIHLNHDDLLMSYFV